MELNLALACFDIGSPAASADEYVSLLQNLISDALGQGADIVAFPELCWAAYPVAAGISETDYRMISDSIQDMVHTHFENNAAYRDKLIILGSAPYYHEETDVVTNRAIILNNGKLLYQDKLNPTRWEVGFAPGEGLTVLSFKGVSLAVIVCLDVEMPEISRLLKKEEIELLLVISATDDELSYERVNRCASARAVELCAYVGVTHLTGKCDLEMVSDNIGNTQVYLPSQSEFSGQNRCETLAPEESGSFLKIFPLDFVPLRRARANTEETNPFHSRPVLPIPADDA